MVFHWHLYSTRTIYNATECMALCHTNKQTHSLIVLVFVYVLPTIKMVFKKKKKRTMSVQHPKTWKRKTKCQMLIVNHVACTKRTHWTFVCFISFRFTLNDIIHVIRQHAMHKGIERKKQYSDRVKFALQPEQILPSYTTHSPTLCPIVCVYEHEIFAFLSQFFITF